MNIYDIAKIAGVSASTVSKVINGKDKDISENTKKKVLKVVEEENYIPYLKFREKEGIKNRIIGLILKKDNKERENIVLSVQEMAGKQGYGVLICYANSHEEIEKNVEEMVKKRVSGLLIDSERAVVNRTLENATIYLSQTQDFDKTLKSVFYYCLSDAGELATERMIQEGHKRIACIILESDQSILEGYKTAMQKAEIPIQSFWTYTGKTLSDIEQYGIRQCLADNVTAVICGSPEITGCFCKIADRMQINIPEGISVISIGDHRWMEIMGSSITSIKFPVADMGYEAVAYLLNMIREKTRIEIVRKFQPTLVERNSIVCPATEKQGDKIVVVGSMNMDVTVQVSRIPIQGETQLAEKLYVSPGGKGANQAVGAGRLGGQVYMIGSLGNDMDGKQIFNNLLENYVHMEGVRFDHLLPSGKAYITVDQDGESTIVVYQGANVNLSIEQINRCRYLFREAKFCLLSMEIPEATTEYAIKCCKQNNTKIILKPSATEKIKDELLSEINYLIPNENELHMLVRGEHTLEEKAQRLIENGVENVIVTLGNRGCYLKNKELSLHFEGSGFEAVDTTGGADSFISAFAVYLSEGKDIIQAIEFAIYASGISVTRCGAQPSLPDRKAVDIYADEIHAKYKMITGRREKDEKDTGCRQFEYGFCN